MVTEEGLPYWHLEHEVLLAEAKANISNSAVEEAGGSEHQDQVEVPGKGGLEEGREGRRIQYKTLYLKVQFTPNPYFPLSYLSILDSV